MHSKQVIFILSETRSGSTWLSYVLGSHQDTAYLGEYQRPFIMPGHTSCRLCESKGRTSCEYLHGIEKIETKNAFDFAFSRLKKTTLIDCSKWLSWLENFVDDKRFIKKVIHLHRDPRAWYASEKRRNPRLKVTNSIHNWINTNKQIKLAMTKWKIPNTTIFYEELCINPKKNFPKIVDTLIGQPFEEQALEYWNIEHHGLGANGASLNNLKRYSNKHVTTGDDKYYVSKHMQQFIDLRWQQELSSDEINSIQEIDILNEYLASIKSSFAYLNMLINE